MNQYAVEYSPEAIATLNSMPDAEGKKVVERLVKFAKNPYRLGASLPGPNGVRVVTVRGIAKAHCEIHDNIRCIVTVRVLRPI